MLNPNRPGGGGGGIRSQAGSSLCCAETVSSRKLKLCDFYYTVFPRIDARGVSFKIRDFMGAFIRGGRSFEEGVYSRGRLFQNFKNSGNRIWTYKNKKTFMPCDQCYLHCDMLTNYSHTYKN